MTTVQDEQIEEEYEGVWEGFWTLRRLLKVVIAAAMVVTLGFVLIARQQQSLEHEQVRARAVACRVLIAVGQDPDPEGDCFTAGTLRFYDPEAVDPILNGDEIIQEHNATQRMLCEVLAMHGQPPPECREA